MFQMKNLSPPQQLSNVLTAIFTNGALPSYVKLILLHNTNATTEVIDIHRVLTELGVPGTPDEANRMFRVTLFPNETEMLQLPGQGLVFDNEFDALFMKSTTLNKVNVSVDGSIG